MECVELFGPVNLDVEDKGGRICDNEVLVGGKGGHGRVCGGELRNGSFSAKKGYPKVLSDEI